MIVFCLTALRGFNLFWLVYTHLKPPCTEKLITESINTSLHVLCSCASQVNVSFIRYLNCKTRQKCHEAVMY